MELTNDHDPKPLHYQMLAEDGRTISMGILRGRTRGWRVSIGKK